MGVRPLLIAAVIFGLSAWLSAAAEDRASPGRSDRPVGCAVLVVIQLIPLPVAWVARMGHATDGFLREYASPTRGACGRPVPLARIVDCADRHCAGLSFLLAFVVFLAGCMSFCRSFLLAGWSAA